MTNTYYNTRLDDDPRAEVQVIRWPADDHRGDYWVVIRRDGRGYEPVKKFGRSLAAKGLAIAHAQDVAKGERP
jgi:hypothetical protein